jgi:hypothetical protein
MRKCVSTNEADRISNDGWIVQLLSTQNSLPVYTTAFEAEEYPQCRTSPVWIFGATIDTRCIPGQFLEGSKIGRLHFQQQLFCATISTTHCVRHESVVK